MAALQRLVGGSGSRTLRDALIDSAKRHDMRLQQLLTEQLDLTIDDLRIHTPKDTGAAAGTEQGARRPIYRSHPGYKMNIGNNPGDTGWQLSHGNDTRNWAIVNPMWDPYLRKINYEHPQGNFLEDAVRRMRDRLAKLRNS